MKQMSCSICSYTYDEARGLPEAGIAPGTKWEDLPEDWKCPLCGASKSDFREKTEQAAPATALDKPHVEKELSAMEMSIICSNLARGCEKQYLPQQAEDFRKLATFFRSKAEPVQEPSVKKLRRLRRCLPVFGHLHGSQVPPYAAAQGGQGGGSPAGAGSE